ncbi:MAG: lysophospholipase [Bacteroidia bacterium]|nr:lysophospholipase [Bacteroidia bacterium]
MSYTVRRTAGKRLSRVLTALIILYTVIAGTLYFLQEQFIFRPSSLAQSYIYQFDHRFEEVFLETDEGVSINALHFTVDRPKGVIIYFHGNAGNLARWGKITSYFVDLDYDVFVMDYRGYGKSTGERNENALYSDSQKCYNYLLQRYNESDIIVYGRSLGSSMATKVASENNPRLLILESPFYSLLDVAQGRFPMFPVKKLLKYEMPNYKHLKAVNCSVTIYHGTNDYVVPFNSGEKLFNESGNSNSEFIVVEGGSHNNLIDYEAYTGHVKKLLE